MIYTLLGACTTPKSMEVVRGLSPKNADDDVAFRTTYYFRAFDYCWDLAAEGSGDGPDYRSIIPQTDTLYRYRMTGKADTLFTQIRFESGVLNESEIDPFGTQVTVDREAGGFYLRTASDIRKEVERNQQSDRQRTQDLRRIRDLVELYRGAEGDEALQGIMKNQIEEAVTAYAGSGAEPNPNETPPGPIEGAMEQEVAGKEVTSGGADPNDTNTDTTPLVADEPSDPSQSSDGGGAGATTSTPAAGATGSDQQPSRARDGGSSGGLCGVGQEVRKGFQIMGPEGFKTFDQSERLVLAMSTSASPLIETLREYSNRITSARADNSGQLLALAQENVRTEQARRALADAQVGQADPTTLLTKTIEAFSGEAGEEEDDK